MPISKKIKADDLENTIICAHWLIEEFEKINLHSVAQIFQRALDDTLSWLNTMSPQDGYFQKYSEDVKTREAQLIRDILIKYASIQNPHKRKKALQKMQLAIQISNDTP